jgi:formylglycine-generating enzyme
MSWCGESNRVVSFGKIATKCNLFAATFRALALKPQTSADRWDENNCRHRNNRRADSVAPVYVYPEGVSGYGTWNQSGNVMDWCSVWHDETDSANTASGEESLRQERGGCWRYPDKFAFSSSQRSFVVSKAVNDFRGFRLVLPVQADS